MSRVAAQIVLSAIATLLTPLAPGQRGTFQIHGSVVDINSRPLTNISVSLHAKELAVERKTLTAANGAFSFENLPPGHYSLRAEASGFNPVLADGLHVEERQSVLTLRLQMEVGFCPATPGLQHYFRLLDAGGDHALTAFRGTVIDENGVAVQGAAVALFIPHRGRIASTHTDGQGSFSFSRLTVSKDYWIQVLKDGFFAGDFTNLDSLPGYDSIYDDLVLERCDPGHCDPNLRKIQTLRCE